MATAIHAKRYLQTFNSVVVCSSSFGLEISADSAETTNSCDTAKAFLQGKYGWSMNDSGPADFADNGADETIFTNVIGGGNVTQSWRPDGTSAVGAANPSYNGSVHTTSYSLSADVGSAVQSSANYQGTGALTRSVA